MDLRQSTPVVIEFGPFLDKADGLALLSGLASAIDHAITGIKLSKNGGTLAVRHAPVTTSTYDAHGCYKVTLDTTDTATLGTLRVIYTDPTTCLPVDETAKPSRRPSRAGARPTRNERRKQSQQSRSRQRWRSTRG